MATTRIIPMHLNKGKSIEQCLGARLDYAMNPEKTNHGELVTAYHCTPGMAQAEFLFSKKRYQSLTGRTQSSDVIAYQVRQSFKPGELTPEEANRIGCEFAMRFLKGNHAFLVATHVDKAHIHNHIIWNSTALDCQRKFRDFHQSGKAVRELSDILCVEHGLSIIEQPKRRGQTYNKWQTDSAPLSKREILRLNIDAALAKKPKDLDALLSLLQAAGYEIKTGKDISVRAQGDPRFIRLSSLKGNYTREALTEILSGKRAHTPRRTKLPAQKEKANLLIDIDAKLREGKGNAYARWAGNFNLKQMAQTLSYLTEHKLLDYADLSAAAENATAKFNQLSEQIKSAEKRMAEIAALRTHIIHYAKTRDVYVGYRKAGYSKKYFSAHESEILLHKAAKAAFDEAGFKKLPSVKSLNAEYAELLRSKKAAYAEYKKSRKEMRELPIHKSNVDRVLFKENSQVPIAKNEQTR